MNISFLLDNPYEFKGKKKILRKQKVSIWCWCNFDGYKRTSIKTEFKVYPGDWSFTRQRMDGTHHLATIINNKLNEIEAAALELMISYAYLSKEQFKSKLDHKLKNIDSPVIHNFISEYVSGYSGRTKNSYQSHAKKIKEDYPNLQFNDLDAKFYSQFAESKSEQGFSNGTIKVFMGFINSFLQYAKNKEYTSIEIPKIPTLKTVAKKLTLTIEEIDFVYQHAIESRNEALLLFMFQYYTARRISELRDFHISQIDQEKKIWTVKTRKNIVTAIVPLDGMFAPAWTILNLLDFKITIPSKINPILKKQFESIGLNRPISKYYFKNKQKMMQSSPLYKVISTHSARASRITHLLEMGTPSQFVQMIAGHKDFNTTKIYDNSGQQSMLNYFTNRTLE